MSIKILFVDDDKAICEIARNVFSLLKNVEFNTASNEKEFYEYINEIEISNSIIDILIVDLRFKKKLSGVSIIEKIKNKKLALFIIAISGFIEETTLIELINLGVDKFFEKPINWKVFLSFIKRIIPYIIDKKQKNRRLIKFKSLKSSIIIENDLDNILPVSYWCIMDISERLSETRINSIVVGLSEVITNAMEHGNLKILPEEKQRLIIEGKLESEFKKRAIDANTEGKYVYIEKIFSENSATFIVEDKGEGFLEDNNLNNLINTSTYFGRGLNMVKIIFDEVIFEKKGSRVILKLYF